MAEQNKIKMLLCDWLVRNKITWLLPDGDWLFVEVSWFVICCRKQPIESSGGNGRHVVMGWKVVIVWFEFWSV